MGRIGILHPIHHWHSKGRVLGGPVWGETLVFCANFLSAIQVNIATKDPSTRSVYLKTSFRWSSLALPSSSVTTRFHFWQELFHQLQKPNDPAVWHMVWRSRSLTHVHTNPSNLIVPLTLLQITFLPVSGDVHPTSLKSKKAAFDIEVNPCESLFFACEHFSPSVCLSHPLSVLCVEATAVKRHFLTFCNLLKVGLVQRQLPLQLVAGGFSTCLPWPRWHAPSPQRNRLRSLQHQRG